MAICSTSIDNLYDNGIWAYFNLRGLDLADWSSPYTLFLSFGHSALRSPSQKEIPLIWNFHIEHTLLKYSSADPCWGTGGVQPLVDVRIYICFLEYKPWKQNIWPRASCVVKQVLEWFLLHLLIAHIWKLLSFTGSWYYCWEREELCSAHPFGSWHGLRQGFQHGSEFVNGCLWLKYWKRFLKTDVRVRVCVQQEFNLVFYNICIKFPAHLNGILQKHFGLPVAIKKTEEILVVTSVRLWQW